MELLDIHTHLIPYNERSGYPRSLTAEELVRAMDGWGIAQAAVLPLESPECENEYALSAEVLDLCSRFPDRLIPFVGADPRQQDVLRKIGHYRDLGARGYGEHKCGLPMDDARSLAVYRVCGELGLPVLFHMDAELNWDEPGLPRLERALTQAPETVFIAHGPCWWSAISGDDDRRGGYASGPIAPGGAADRLLCEQPNLYADISANSGHNALTRDPDFTAGFIERHWRKLLLGTDYFIAGQEVPQIDWLEAQAMPKERRGAIGRENAAALLGLE